MKTEGQQNELRETCIVADQILQKYKHDRSYFESNSQEFDKEFLVEFEKKVKTLVRLTPLQAIGNVLMEKDEKIQIVINYFYPLIYITEAYLRCIPKVTGVPVTNFSLDALRDAVNRKCALDIERSCRNIINEFEEHIEEFIDLGFLSIILTDFHVLTDILEKKELELVDIVIQRCMFANDLKILNNPFESFVKDNVKANPVVFVESYLNREEYSFEELVNKNLIQNNQQSMNPSWQFG